MQGFPNRSYENVADALSDYSTLEGHIEDLCCATCEAEKRESSGILHLVYHKEGSTSPTTQIDVSFTSPEEANALTDRLAESLADKGIERFHIGFNNAYTLWPKRHLRAVKWKRSKLNIESCTTDLSNFHIATILLAQRREYPRSPLDTDAVRRLRVAAPTGACLKEHLMHGPVLFCHRVVQSIRLGRAVLAIEDVVMSIACFRGTVCHAGCHEGKVFFFFTCSSRGSRTRW